MRFFDDFGGFGAPKLEPKSTKNRSTSLSKTRYDFEWIWGGPWTDFGWIWEGKLEPSWV